MSQRTRTITVAREGQTAALADAPQLIMVLGCEPLTPSRHLLAGVDRVDIGRGRASAPTRRVAGGLGVLDLRVADRSMSEAHATILRAHGRFLFEDRGSKNGSLVNGAAVASAVLADGDVIELGHSFFMYRDAVAPLPGPPDLGADALHEVAGLRTFLAELAASFRALGEVAPALVPVLVLGETGSGKEVAARAVHDLSRRSGPFVAVNCGAIAPDLVAAELFGHRRGAFSGAVDNRPGHFRSADRGTLFLDEISELPLAAQPALLRALQEREVVAVGESLPQAVDVRVVAASNRDLEALVERGAFRRDLHARLGGLVVTLPALAERREDLGIISAALLRRQARAATFSPEAARALLRHDWPQNVRELDLALAAAAARAGGGRIELGHLPPAVREEAAPRALPTPEDNELREALVRNLAEHGGNIAAVARAMGKGRMQIHRWLKRFGMTPGGYRR